MPESGKSRKWESPVEEQYLKIAANEGIPVSIHFQDGEVWNSALIKEVLRFTLIVTVDGFDHCVFKNALKRIGAVCIDRQGMRNERASEVR